MCVSGGVIAVSLLLRELVVGILSLCWNGRMRSDKTHKSSSVFIFRMFSFCLFYCSVFYVFLCCVLFLVFLFLC